MGDLTFPNAKIIIIAYLWNILLNFKFFFFNFYFLIIFVVSLTYGLRYSRSKKLK